MPQHVINMLDGLLENGGDEDIKVLGEGIKATLEIVSDMDANLTGTTELLKEHVKDKECHTPKGILLRNNVAAWFVGLVLLISSIVTYAPELVKRLADAIP